MSISANESYLNQKMPDPLDQNFMKIKETHNLLDKIEERIKTYINKGEIIGSQRKTTFNLSSSQTPPPRGELKSIMRGSAVNISDRQIESSNKKSFELNSQYANYLQPDYQKNQQQFDLLKEVQDIERSCRIQLDSLQQMNDSLQQNNNFLKSQNESFKLTINQLQNQSQRHIKESVISREVITTLTEENTLLSNEIKLLNEQINHDQIQRVSQVKKQDVSRQQGVDTSRNFNKRSPIIQENDNKLNDLKYAVERERNKTDFLKNDISEIRTKIEKQKENSIINDENSKMIVNRQIQSGTLSSIENKLKRVEELQDVQGKQNQIFMKNVIEIISQQGRQTPFFNESIKARKYPQIEGILDVQKNQNLTSNSSKELVNQQVLKEVINQDELTSRPEFHKERVVRNTVIKVKSATMQKKKQKFKNKVQVTQPFH